MNTSPNELKISPLNKFNRLFKCLKSWNLSVAWYLPCKKSYVNEEKAWKQWRQERSSFRDNEIVSYLYSKSLHFHCTHDSKRICNDLLDNWNTEDSFLQTNKDASHVDHHLPLKLKRARTRQLSLTLPNKGNKKLSSFARFVNNRFWMPLFHPVFNL